MIKSLLTNALAFVNHHNICIVGATSGLGKELIYQAITKPPYNTTILALTGSSPDKITYPSRTNTFKKCDTFTNERLTVDNYWTLPLGYTYDHLIFSTRAPPFDYDYTYLLMISMLKTLPSTCKTITWIKPRCEWYNDHSTKLQKEIILSTPRTVKRFTFRPKTLGNESNGITRQKLAYDILMRITSPFTWRRFLRRLRLRAG